MKNTIKKFGIYGALIGGVIFSSTHFLVEDIGFDLLEIFGYASIFISLSFVFFGIKHYRDKINEGIISFKNAMIIGLTISAIVGIMIGLLDIVYVTVINPDFTSEYLQYALEGMKESMSVEEFEIEKEILINQMKFFENPSFAGLIMFITVFLIGLIISLISSLILQNKK